MSKKIFFIGAILAGLAVLAGAFGAHGLQQITADESIWRTYQAAVQYQFWHAVAILLVGIYYRQEPKRCFQWASYCFAGGIVMFSGSLYMITYCKILACSVGAWGFVAPLGGLLFIGGWGLFGWGLLKQEGSN